MYEIEFTNTQNHISLQESFVREIVEKTLSAEGVAEASIGVAIVDDTEIHTLNRQYLNHDYETDVLSFLLESEDVSPAEAPAASSGTPSFRGTGKRIEGELAVSAETAAGRAAEFGWSGRDELVLYVVHGLLHLCGYDDQSAEEKRIMQVRERSMLALWGLIPSYAEPADTDAPQGPPAVERSQEHRE